MDSRIEVYRADSLIGNAYWARVLEGPFARFSTGQESHVEPGLQFYLRNLDPSAPSDVEAEKGVVLHGYFDGTLKGEKLVIPEEHDWCKKPLEEFNKLVEKHQIVPKLTEKMYVSKLFGLGCQIDFIGQVENLPALGDWKTGSLYQSQLVQLATYRVIHFENSGEWIDRLFVGHVHRDGKKAKLHWVEEAEAALYAGFHTYERWKWDNRKNLRWACAPDEILEERKKLRGKKREDFELASHRPEYVWPWLNINAFAAYQALLERRNV